MAHYTYYWLKERVDDQTVIIDGDDMPTQRWRRSGTLRDWKCHRCGRDIPAGSSCYRPAESQVYAWRRLCEDCIHELEEE